MIPQCALLYAVLVLYMHTASADWLVKPLTFEDSGSLVYNGTEEYDKHINFALSRTYKDSDGEAADAMEHYFYGQMNGIAMELGGLDGSFKTGSQTVYFEDFNWKRIIVDGNPIHRRRMKKLTNAMGVNAAICSQKTKLHYVQKDVFSGIIEFMAPTFLKRFLPEMCDSIDFDTKGQNGMNVIRKNATFGVYRKHVIPVDCIPLSTLFVASNITHVNFFVLDVEGGEYSILTTIDWKSVIFDVIVIETQPEFRSEGNFEKIQSYLAERGYSCLPGYETLGRNSWFVRNDFVPSKKPGIVDTCFRGVDTSRRKTHPGLSTCKKKVVTKNKKQSPMTVTPVIAST